MKKLVLTSLVAALGFTAQANAATPEVSASVSVANTYLFRGVDLGAGSAQVAGDLIADFGGAYAGAWLSSRVLPSSASTGTETVNAKLSL